MITIANWISNFMVFSTALVFFAVGLFIIYLIVTTIINREWRDT